jgi:hypothetical protein
MDHLGVALSRCLQTRVSCLRTLFLRVLRLILALRRRVSLGLKNYGRCYRLTGFGVGRFGESLAISHIVTNSHGFAFTPLFHQMMGHSRSLEEGLDGRAPSCIETYEGGAGLRLDDEFGCWKITGHYKDQELSFIVWVVPLTEQKSLSGGSTAEVLPEPSTSLPEPRRIHVDGSVQARSLVYRVAPELPHEARVANVSGTVVLHAVINRGGRAREVQYLSDPPVL